jgi:hypothetical protein
MVNILLLLFIICFSKRAIHKSVAFSTDSSVDEGILLLAQVLIADIAPCLPFVSIFKGQLRGTSRIALPQCNGFFYNVSELEL